MTSDLVQVIQALGKSFHPDCFHCVICKEKLEGQSFNVDTQQKIYCVKDYQRWTKEQLLNKNISFGLNMMDNKHYEITWSVWGIVTSCLSRRCVAQTCEACGLLILPTEVHFSCILLYMLLHVSHYDILNSGLLMSTGFEWDCTSGVHGKKLSCGLLWGQKQHLIKNLYECLTSALKRNFKWKKLCNNPYLT